jgi:hypothetical protein
MPPAIEVLGRLSLQLDPPGEASAGKPDLGGCPARRVDAPLPGAKKHFGRHIRPAKYLMANSNRQIF